METETKDTIKFIIFLVVVVLLFIWNNNRFDNTILSNVDMKPFAEPIQEDLPEEKYIQLDFKHGYVKITPVAKYKIYARVYDNHYMPSKLSFAAVIPYDITLGWGGLQSKEVFKTIRTTMTGRLVYWRINSKCPYSVSQINSMLSNNHLIPANRKVRKGIKN